MSKNKKKYGRLVIDLGYVVEIGNEDMINTSRECFIEDIMSAIKYSEVSKHIELIEDNKARKRDIPEHIKEIIKIK